MLTISLHRLEQPACLELLVAQLIYGLQNLFHTFVVQNDALFLAELVSGDYLRLHVSGLANQDRQLRIVLLDRLIELGYEVSVAIEEKKSIRIYETEFVRVFADDEQIK